MKSQREFRKWNSVNFLKKKTIKIQKYNFLKTINPNSTHKIYDSDILNFFYNRYLNKVKTENLTKKNNLSLYFQNKVKKDLAHFLENRNNTICFRNEFNNLTLEKKKTLELYEKKFINTLDHPLKVRDYLQKNSQFNKLIQFTFVKKK